MSMLNKVPRKLYDNSTSGYTGVSFAKDKGMWQSRLVVDGKKHHLGLYRSLEEAVYARRAGEEACPCYRGYLTRWNGNTNKCRYAE